MSHKKEDLNRVVNMLQKDYPRPLFRYELDSFKFFQPLPDGSTTFPDVQIFNGKGSTPICVVEIGYTRPEKLHHYKATGIPDIRWYGRDNGILYSYGSIEPVTVPVKLNYSFEKRPGDVWRKAYLADSTILCPAALDAFFRLHEEIGTISSKFGKMRRAKQARVYGDLHDSVVSRHWEFFQETDLIDALISDDLNPLIELTDEALSEDVGTDIWSNGYGILPCTHCEVCEESRINFDDFVHHEMEEQFTSYESFLYSSAKSELNYISCGYSPQEAKEAHERELISLFHWLSAHDVPDVESNPSWLDSAVDWGKSFSWLKVQ